MPLPDLPEALPNRIFTRTAFLDASMTQWINLHVVDPHRIGRLQADLADHSVPVRLRVIAYLMRIADRRMLGVIYEQRQTMAARRQQCPSTYSCGATSEFCSAHVFAVEPQPAGFGAF